jgi:transcriptional regulator with XRE-family HTH domain
MDQRHSQRGRRQVRVVTFGPDKHEREDVISAFGGRVRALRVGAGLSQEALAMRSFLRRSQVWEIESGRRAPDMPALLVLADRLDVPAASLIEGLDPPVRRVGTAQVLDLITQEPGIKQDALIALSGLPDWYVVELTLYLQSVGAIVMVSRGWRIADLPSVGSPR